MGGGEFWLIGRQKRHVHHERSSCAVSMRLFYRAHSAFVCVFETYGFDLEKRLLSIGEVQVLLAQKDHLPNATSRLYRPGTQLTGTHRIQSRVGEGEKGYSASHRSTRPLAVSLMLAIMSGIWFPARAPCDAMQEWG